MGQVKSPGSTSTPSSTSGRGSSGTTAPRCASRSGLDHLFTRALGHWVFNQSWFVWLGTHCTVVAESCYSAALLPALHQALAGGPLALARAGSFQPTYKALAILRGTCHAPRHRDPDVGGQLLAHHDLGLLPALRAGVDCLDRQGAALGLAVAARARPGALRRRAAHAATRIAPGAARLRRLRAARAHRFAGRPAPAARPSPRAPPSRASPGSSTWSGRRRGELRLARPSAARRRRTPLLAPLACPRRALPAPRRAAGLPFRGYWRRPARRASWPRPASRAASSPSGCATRCAHAVRRPRGPDVLHLWFSLPGTWPRSRRW